MQGSKMNAQTIRELQKLSESSQTVINRLADSIRELATTSTDSPHFDSAMRRIQSANREADELLKAQNSMLQRLQD